MEEEGDINGAARLDLDARTTDGRAARLLAILPEDAFLLRIKFLRGRDEGDWVLEDKFDPVRVEGKKGGTVLEIARDTKPGVLTGIDKFFYQNAYHVTAAVYGLYVPHQGSRSYQSGSVEARRPQLCRPTGSGVFPGRFEGRGANVRTASENS